MRTVGIALEVSENRQRAGAVAKTNYQTLGDEIMPNVSRHDHHRDTWMRMLKMGYTPAGIAKEYRVDQRVVRYVTDPAFREAAQVNARKWHQQARIDLKATLAERKVWTAAPVGFTALPSAEAEPVVVEFFHHMPPWPKPRWQTSFEERRNA
jgi:hypothetical protein